MNNEVISVVDCIKENLIRVKNNIEYDYTVENYLENYKDILNSFEYADERLKALIMLYVVNPTLEEVKKWDLQTLEDYIYDTVDDVYVKEYEKLFEIIKKGK